MIYKTFSSKKCYSNKKGFTNYSEYSKLFHSLPISSPFFQNLLNNVLNHSTNNEKKTRKIVIEKKRTIFSSQNFILETI